MSGEKNASSLGLGFVMVCLVFPENCQSGLELLVCPHLHHSLLAEQEVVAVVCIRSDSKFATHMVHVALLEHRHLEVQVILWPAMDHKLRDLFHVGT